MIANGGLANDVQREELWNIFSKHGCIMDIVMKPKKPYAFITFSTELEALEAINSIHGRTLLCPEELSTPGVVFYLSYLQQSKYCGGIVQS